MEKIDDKSVRELMETQAKNAVTIYIPMHVTASPPHISENQIRFKNLLSRAADKLESGGSGKSDFANELRQTIDANFNDLGFWENQTPGLLICAIPGSIRMFHIPIDTEEYCAVDDHFHLAPILGLIRDEQKFYVLTLAQHDPSLLEGDMYGLSDSGIELPRNIREALNIDEPNQKSENQGTASGPSLNNSWYNGRGGAKNPQEEDRLRFFRMIDDTICKHTDSSRPLIVAGIEAEVAEYREISKYPNILKGFIAGNHTGTAHEIMFDKAKSLLWQEITAPQHMEAVEEYQRLEGANPTRVTSETDSILEAAKQGRIDKLFTIARRNTTDTVRDQSGQVQRLTFPDSDKSKDLNDAAQTVWQTSGTVYNLMPEEMPDGKFMAARLRY